MSKKKKTPDPIVAKLQALRARLGITQAKAAELTGVATRTWISWENAHRKPGTLALNLLKRTFPDWF